VSDRGEYLGAFGDAAFQRELQASRSRIAAAAVWRKAAWASFAITLVIGFLLAWRYSEKPGHRAAEQAFAALAPVPAEVPRGVVVLKAEDWYGRQAAWVVAGTGLLMLLFPALLVLVVFPHEIPPSFWRNPKVLLAAGLVVLMWAGVGVTLWYLWDQAQRRLVLTNGFAQVHAGERTVASVPVREVVVSPQALLIGRTMLPYRSIKWPGRPGRWIYDEDRITRYLLAHLPPAQRVAQPELARASLKRMPLSQQLAIGLPLAALLAFELWRVLVR
jgi:hypothetical protein